MAIESQIPIASGEGARSFALRLAVFYAAVFGLIGTHLPFFPVWLKAIGVEAGWIGLILAAPAVTRFTVLPLITGFVERHQWLRRSLTITAIATAIGFAAVGSSHVPLLVFATFLATACTWTPMIPLTDAYALRAVMHYGLDYGPLRLWGSAAFIVGALACGLLVDAIAPVHLIWIIVAVAASGALASLWLRRCPELPPRASVAASATHLLRQPVFLAIIMASALIQGSHAAYYAFASIDWQSSGLGGLTIAGLWSLGVLAEIVIFALSPRIALPPSMLVVIGGVSGLLRWSIIAQEPPLIVLIVVQLMHGLTYGITQVGTMNLLMRNVPGDRLARGQGYLAACTGIVTSSASIACGVIYASYGQKVYYLGAAMAFAGAAIMWAARRRLAD